MAISEFDVIQRFFASRTPLRNDVVLGIGDDAALLKVPEGQQLAVAVDTLIADRHFPAGTDPFDIGYKSLSVNLSDMAAMGASPAWATLSLTIPEADEQWLQGFADGFFSLATHYGMALVGGDTTRGPLSVTVQVYGLVRGDRVLRRDGARPGQAVLVTGTLGDAARALEQMQAGGDVDAFLLTRLNRPEPRVAFGLALAGIGSAAIDISDGLLADLGHIVKASHCGATLWVDRLPASSTLKRIGPEQRLPCQLYGGDDYELCFTVDADKAEQVIEIAGQQRLAVTEIGVIEAAPGLRCVRDDGSVYQPQRAGFDHFADENRDKDTGKPGI
ncbi:thiamine-phosphate kinase [Thiogranum longum]